MIFVDAFLRIIVFPLLWRCHGARELALFGLHTWCGWVACMPKRRRSPCCSDRPTLLAHFSSMEDLVILVRHRPVHLLELSSPLVGRSFHVDSFSSKRERERTVRVSAMSYQLRRRTDLARHTLTWLSCRAYWATWCRCRGRGNRVGFVHLYFCCAPIYFIEQWSMLNKKI